jgi:hypothetical protein
VTSRRLTLGAFVVFAAIVSAPALGSVEGQETPDLKTTIDRLAAFDYSTRMNAARTVRRAPPADVVPALTAAARNHSDSFVRYRALVVLTAFNDPGTPGLMRTLLGDRNDRVREVAYRWFELHPEPSLTPTLLGALNTETAEFVRPALIRALAATMADAQVQRALVTEAGRGLDFFRSAVIQALGDYHALFAADAMAAIAKVDGPLQDDAVLALARIGGLQATATLKTLSSGDVEVASALEAAQCLLGSDCAARVKTLADGATRPNATPEGIRARLAAMGAIAMRGDAAAMSALFGLASNTAPAIKRQATVVFAGVALRRPTDVIDWLAGATEETRARAIDLLHEGFDALEEDFAEEQFFATVRAAYWKSPDGSPERTIAATLIDKLEF